MAKRETKLTADQAKKILNATVNSSLNAALKLAEGLAQTGALPKEDAVKAVNDAADKWAAEHN